MEVGRDFINTPTPKTVRFGDYVANTLEKLKRGDRSDYEMIKHQLSDPDIKDAQIISWLQEFRSCVTQLGKEHEQLIYVVLRLPWLGRGPAVVDEYLMFLSNLISAQTVYLRPCLKILVSNFTLRRIKIREGNVDISDSDDEDDNLPRIFDQCHQALQMIVKYVPSTGRFLMPILSDNFPFVQKSSRTLECYVHNLLRIAVYIPTLRRDVLELIISKMLTLDVSAPRSAIEEAESMREQNLGAAAQDDCLFDMDEEGPGPDDVAMSHAVAERLDALMLVLLAFIRDVIHTAGVLDVEKTKSLYRDLLSVFDKLVLPTHASCHVQFCIFYLCSFRLALSEAFLDHLWKIIQNPSQPAILRQAAAGYMGSLLARARFIPIATVRACLDLLVPWLHLYIDGQDSGSRAFCDVALHGPFYASCQAVFYSLVFRHRAILDGNMKKGLAYLQGLNLERIVMCQLNPLKVCLPAVTNMFAAITRKYQLVFCYTIIERNNRHMLPVVRSSAGGDSLSTNTNPLDTFFPFDPYLLKRSGKLFESLYQVWEEPPDCMAPNIKENPASKGGEDEDDDFLLGSTPQGDAMMAGSYEGHMPSPGSVGSPPVASPPTTFLMHSRR